MAFTELTGNQKVLVMALVAHQNTMTYRESFYARNVLTTGKWQVHLIDRQKNAVPVHVDCSKHDFMALEKYDYATIEWGANSCSGTLTAKAFSEFNSMDTSSLQPNNQDEPTLQTWARAGLNKVILALVFTDIVDSTELGSKMGDDKWIQILQKHFARARELKTTHQGYEIKLIGDAVMMAFNTAAEALSFAIDFFIDTGDKQIKIRAGIHIGQVRIIENDLYGRMVNITSRIEHSLDDPGIALSKAAHDDVLAEIGTDSTSIKFREYEYPAKGIKQPLILT